MKSTLAALLALYSVYTVSSVPLVGYVCPTCPSATNPTQLFQSISKYYTKIMIAFIVWDNDGNIVNQYDDPSKGFYLSRSTVSNLQSEGREVYISIGGGAGPPLDCSKSSNSAWVTKFANGIINTTSTYGMDGVDFDIEHRSGDFVACSNLIKSVMDKLHSNGLKCSIAPQMTNLYPELTTVSGGFNELAPLISMASTSELPYVMPQMYNTWGAVETVAWAKQYTEELNAGYSVNSDGQNFAVQVSPNRIFLGYPASPSGAGSGYINPSQLKGLYNDLKSEGLEILGFMTWSIGWDQQSGWNFANTLGPL